MNAPQHGVRSSKRTIRDELADFISDIRMDPQFAFLCACLGCAAGTLPVVVAFLVVLVRS